jgi:integrase
VCKTPCREFCRQDSKHADFVKPAVLALGLVTKSERFGWHRFRHSLSTWANEMTKDITVSQTLLRHSKPEMTAVYTHGNFDKALEAQRKYYGAIAGNKTRIGGTQ